MFRLFKQEPKPSSTDPLDQVILGFSDQDPFTIRDACEGIQIFGGIGSGKTSGSGAHLAAAFLDAGFGGLVLAAKPDEPELWRRYLEQAGRSDDLLMVGPAHGSAFNVLDYETSLPDAEIGLTENLVALFDTLVQVATRSSGKSGNDNEAFWRNEQRKLVRNAVDALRLSARPISFANIYAIVQSAARSPDELTDTQWQKDSFCFQTMAACSTREKAGELSEDERHDLKMCGDYWASEFPNQAERTRSNITATFTGMADSFLRGLLRQVFCGKTTFTPDDSLAGKVIVLDLPIKKHHDAAIYAQVLFKYCWQRAVERRAISPDSRPVFLWIDEAQHFVNEHDVSFQTTARSSRVSTVLLTQNLPNYLYALGGDTRGRALVDSLLGNLVTKIFHNNTCAQTNQYAADLFAKDWQQRDSQSFGRQQSGESYSTSIAPHLEYTVLPRELSGLLKGGPENNFQVEAIVHQGGKTFNLSGTNALRTVFRQTISSL